MSIRLTQEKAITLQKRCHDLRVASRLTIRELACVIGEIISSFPGVMYGPLYYRSIESDKSKALNSKRGNFDAYMTLSRKSTAELEWWENNVLDNKNVISHGAPSHTLTTDASNLGWGAVFENDSTGGTWSVKEQKHHINFLNHMGTSHSPELNLLGKTIWEWEAYGLGQPISPGSLTASQTGNLEPKYDKQSGCSIQI
ncbi:predicted protein [Nematostella vectensis]|uniref:Uncharacterized protein n=1 Tax=Nematostella vectensis TaxID=45351 RepID=A7SAW9_NEMVE|nr:predicted protein [Nematostella vectensis]|eukprot:XP_001631218.1 predicted protein [Nematostella vectensis]